MTRKSPRAVGQHVAWVSSENDADVEYELKLTPDGRTVCGCLAFVFSKTSPKSCKHIDGHASLGRRALNRLTTTVRGERVTVDETERVSVTHKGKTETLVVRRAISFGGPL